jgi:hypothetical protein
VPPFDRTLVIDLYGLPVPQLCYERHQNQAVPIESASQQAFFEKVLEYNTYRFPELLRSAVAAGFEWGDDPDIRKALLRTGGK